MTTIKNEDYAEDNLKAFGAVLCLGFFVRLYGITAPFLDSISERQTIVAMMARNLYLDGMNPLYTRLDIFGNNIGWAIFEFPLVPWIAAGFYFIFGEQELVGRLVVVGFSLGAMVVVYFIARHFIPPNFALFSMGVFAFSPMSIYFGRAFMADSAMVFFSLVSIFYFLKWLKVSCRQYFWLSLFCASIALLLKPTAIYIYGPIVGGFFLKYRWRFLIKGNFWVYVSLMIMPFVFWFLHANQVNWQNPDFPVAWHWTGVVVERGGAPWQWWLRLEFYAALAKSIIFVTLTPIGFIAMIGGLIYIKSIEQKKWIMYGWILSLIFSFFGLAGAQVGHPYYQLPILPLGAVLGGIFVCYVSQQGYWISIVRCVRDIKVYRNLCLCGIICIVLGYGAGYYYFFDYMYDLKSRRPFVMEIAELIKKNSLSGEAFVLHQPGAMAGSVLTYYSKRKSWNFAIDRDGIYNSNVSDKEKIDDLERFRDTGGVLFVAMNTRYGNAVDDTKKRVDFYNHLISKYVAVVTNENYLIFRSP